jgi:hypothetical protein
MSNSEFIKLKTLVSEVKSIIPDSRIDRPQLMKWGHDALGRMEIPDNLVQSIICEKIENNQIVLPENTHSVVQIAVWTSKNAKIRRKQVIEWVQKVHGTDCEVVMSLECPKCKEVGDCTCSTTEIVIEADRIDQLANPEWYYNHMKWYTRHGGLGNDNQNPYLVSMYNQEFQLAKSKTHDFFNADFHIPGCLNLDQKLCANQPIEYHLDYPVVQFNRKDGWVLLSILKRRVDDEGYRMLPNITEVIDAVKWYMVFMTALSMTMTATDPTRYDRLAQRAERLYKEAIGEAIEILSTPDFPSFWANLEQFYFKGIKNRDNAVNAHTPDTYQHMMNRLTKN